MRTLLLFAACLAPILAVETDPKVQAKTVWTAAAKAGDAWTCLQLESWARTRKPAVRLGSILGESTLIGEPLFTFPVHIDYLADLNDRIIVVARSRVHVLAPDGRPLQASQLAPPGRYHALGYDGKVLAVWAREDERFQLTGLRVADGERTIAISSPLGAGLSQGEGLAIADDGSAAAAQIEVEDPGTGHVTFSTLLANGGRSVRTVDLPGGLLGVGRRGSWLIAGSPPNLTVLVGEARRKAVAAAVGPGIAASIDDGAAHLILPDGRSAALTGAPALGSEPGMATVGGWLVMFSGYEAKVVSQGDLLGEGGGVETVQPPTLALWRWSDLAADPAAKPVTTMVGELSVCGQHPAALWLWAGKRLDILDLSGTEPRREEHLEATAPIKWAASELHCVRLNHDQGRKALHGPDKSLLWIGQCSDIDVKRRDLALIERSRGGQYAWSLVRLSVDPAKRTETRLDLTEQEQGIRVSYKAPDIVVARGERSWWRSTGFDGKVIQTERDAGPAAVPPPSSPEWRWYTPTGRFWRDGVRVRLKLDPPVDDPLDAMELADAWRLGTTAILLDASGRVLVTGRKRGEWVDLPALAPADRLALAGSTPVLAFGDELRPVASIAPGPKLEPREGLGALMELPSGSWRVERRWRFTPPRMRQLEWDAERLGWHPLWLRSPESGGMLIVTPALVIDLDPAAAKLFGR
jgi:hypothetical protein